MQIVINGEARAITDGLSLHALVEQMSLPPARIAIELNREVVRRADWPETFLAAGDKLEIVHFVGGG